MNFRLSVCREAVFLFLWLAVLFGIHPSFAADNAANEEENLKAVYLRYQKESMQLKPDRMPAFLTFWEKEFQNVLTGSTSTNFLRLRMLDELGTIQGRLGKPQASAETYKTMAATAREAHDLESQVIAVQNQFELGGSGPVEDLTNTAGLFESLSQQLVDQRDSAGARKRYCDALVEIGTILGGRSKSSPENSTHLLEQAKRAMEQSVALGDEGTTPLVSRLCNLGGLQSALHLREEAAATYGKVLDTKQTLVSPLYVEFLRAHELATPETPEYRQVLEHALQKHIQRGERDEYEATFRHELGLSYQRASQFQKSTEVLSPNLKADDKELSAYDLYLIAQNYRSLGDASTADGLMKDLKTQYPKSGTVDMVESHNRDSRQPSAPKTAVTRVLLVCLTGIPIVFLALRRFLLIRKKA